VFARVIKPLSPAYPKGVSFAVTSPIYIEADGDPSTFKGGVDATAGPDRIPPYCLSPVFCDTLVGWDTDGGSELKDLCCVQYPERPYCLAGK
jgi:hypothetical protein